MPAVPPGMAPGPVAGVSREGGCLAPVELVGNEEDVLVGAIRLPGLLQDLRRDCHGSRGRSWVAYYVVLVHCIEAAYHHVVPSITCHHYRDLNTAEDPGAHDGGVQLPLVYEHNGEVLAGEHQAPQPVGCEAQFVQRYPLLHCLIEKAVDPFLVLTNVVPVEGFGSVVWVCADGHRQEYDLKPKESQQVRQVYGPYALCLADLAEDCQVVGEHVEGLHDHEHACQTTVPVMALVHMWHQQLHRVLL
mmetsp:Transcript_4997/g.13975  ORF Transcript_4997/g.13975 Transcript_4997/m.13975 type:complete len:246 (-) Transcript_4997:447-1184(-)|eukprot:CAMPEP_0117691594 /NCGR_PEP_ID=MMETSP0804-20121206/25811_1 /TAXON_ID=1074897 /ORGANISM="Tetraselmis astigmatica, Strain CCMP880" /LENGTH=245 /DNA_ID=CAMNT_0005504853 /DNA_START=240 /DNA_END=977 /DNA_ORIENTATION=+